MRKRFLVGAYVGTSVRLSDVLLVLQLSLLPPQRFSHVYADVVGSYLSHLVIL